MREIKFRAWDKSRNQWADRLCWATGIKSDGSCYAGGSDNLELCLFTGLKDKNSKEAYQDDLCIDEFNNIWRIDWSIEYAGFELALIEAGDKMFGEIDKLNICRVIDTEVISNIHENPELLQA